MANPTRPVQDAIIDPVWGQWVHDNIANKVIATSHTSMDVTFANGYASLTAAQLGLASVLGVVASCKYGTPITQIIMIQAKATGPAGEFYGFTVNNTTISPLGSGVLPLQVVAWGTPLP